MGGFISVIMGPPRQQQTATGNEDNRTINTTKPATHNISLVAILGGYAMEAYCKPTVEGKTISVDGTRIILTSFEWAKSNYSGVLAMTLRQYTSKYDGDEEDVPHTDAEILLSIVHKDFNPKSLPPPTKEPSAKGTLSTVKVVSSCESSSKVVNAALNEPATSYLFIKDPLVDALQLSAYCDHTFYADRTVGVDRMSIIELQKKYPAGKATLGTTFSLYSETDKIKSNAVDSESKNSCKSQTDPSCELQVDVQYTSFHDSSDHIADLFTSSSPMSTSLLEWVKLAAIVKVPNTIEKETHCRLCAGIVDEKYLQQVCCLDNAETGTQAGIWADTTHKQLVISFRGSEADKLRDLISDVTILQETYQTNNGTLSKLKVHSGFMECFRSVRIALLHVLHSLFCNKISDSENKWDIFLTGHSLGGALSTLCSFELARMKAGLWGLKDDPSSVYRTDLHFMDVLGKASITNYSFGAPRVGNDAFRTAYDELVPHTFRVVNSQDIVPRIPQTCSHPGVQVVIDKVHVAKEAASYSLYINPFTLFSGASVTQHASSAYLKSTLDAVKHHNSTSSN